MPRVKASAPRAVAASNPRERPVYRLRALAWCSGYQGTSLKTGWFETCHDGRNLPIGNEKGEAHRRRLLLQTRNNLVDCFLAFNPYAGFFHSQQLHTLQLRVIDKVWTHHDHLMTDQSA